MSSVLTAEIDSVPNVKGFQMGLSDSFSYKVK